MITSSRIAAPAEGATFADYTIDEQLFEEPAVGRVLLGRKRGTCERACIKVLDAPDDALRHAFVERGAFLAAVDHPNVARVIEAGTAGRTKAPWTATAHGPALSLSEIVECLGPRLDEPLVLQLCLALCQGLVSVADRFGFHGDVRPHNFAITPEGTARLLDQGFPSSVGRVVLRGSLPYAAPELVEGRIDSDVRADLYALGVSMFVLLTGQSPRAPGAADARALSSGAATILLGLAAADRDERYDGPRQAGQDIIRALRGEAPIGPRGKFAGVALEALVRASGVFAGESALRAVHERVARAQAARGREARRTSATPTPPPAGSTAADTKRFFYARALNAPSSREQPIEVDTKWMERATFQASWCNGEKTDWKEICSKRDYYFRHAMGEDANGFPALGRPSREEEPLNEAEMKAREAAGGGIILSDDGSRAYQVIRDLGRGGQGVVRLVRVMGDQSFEGFGDAVEEAVIKTSKDPECLEREHAIYRKPDQGIVKMLDAGTCGTRRGYLILERLYLHPLNMFASDGKRMNVDVATAIDTYVNLLEVLSRVHVRREKPIILGDVKPDNIMLRMTNRGGTPTLQEYLRRLAAGAYEPVFMDMGCAQERDALRASGGHVDALFGTPIYLPPESTPVIDDVRFEAGVYGPKTDVYALTLSFYEYLTAGRPYQATGLYRLRGRELLEQILELKHARVSPIDSALLFDVLGPETKTFRRILDMGLDPDPERRPSALSMLEECKRTFKVTQNYVKALGDYRYDEGKGLKLVQQRFPRIDPTENRYLAFRAKVAAEKRARIAAPDQMTVDEWYDSQDGRSDALAE